MGSATLWQLACCGEATRINPRETRKGHSDLIKTQPRSSVNNRFGWFSPQAAGHQSRYVPTESSDSNSSYFLMDMRSSCPETKAEGNNQLRKQSFRSSAELRWKPKVRRTCHCVPKKQSVYSHWEWTLAFYVLAKTNDPIFFNSNPNSHRFVSFVTILASAKSSYAARKTNIEPAQSTKPTFSKLARGPFSLARPKKRRADAFHAPRMITDPNRILLSADC